MRREKPSGALSYFAKTRYVVEVVGRQEPNLLWALARERLALTDEAAFVDAVSDSLDNGAFDLVVLGDGIRSKIETVRGFLEAAAGLRSRLALVEVTSWADEAGRMLITPQVALRTKVIEHQAAPYVAGTSLAPLQVEAASSRSDEVSQSGTANRQFWDRFIATTRFSHPDQRSPSHGGNNWVRLALPVGTLTLYRERRPQGLSSRCGMTLRLRGEAGRTAFDALCAELSELNGEFGMPFNALWNESEEVGRIWPAPLGTMDEGEQLAWLVQTSDRLVTAFRPPLSALAG
jgi:hypothetical protein